MGLMFQLVIMVAFGAACAGIAHSRGRSAVGWFFIGVLAGCIGLIILLVLPNVKLEQERHDQLRRENRRLRERLRKDRQVADQRHAAVKHRLGVHDEAMGIDTTRGLGSPETQHLAAASGPEAPPAPPSGWYYLEGQERYGPMDLVQLKELWKGGRVGRETLVWAKHMKDWQPVAEVPDLLRALHG